LPKTALSFNIKIAREACPLELAPTSSTTAALVMGDALAIALWNHEISNSMILPVFIPEAALGVNCLVKVKDLMRTDKLPFIDEEASFMDLLLKMSEGRLGMVMVGDATCIKGIITDGDLRTALLNTRIHQH
jgi:arabinose-5-phosphate isomerase